MHTDIFDLDECSLFPLSALIPSLVNPTCHHQPMSSDTNWNPQFLSFRPVPALRASAKIHTSISLPFSLCTQLPTCLSSRQDGRASWPDPLKVQGRQITCPNPRMCVFDVGCSLECLLTLPRGQRCLRVLCFLAFNTRSSSLSKTFLEKTDTSAMCLTHGQFEFLQNCVFLFVCLF